jgi:hypothetical protein
MPARIQSVDALRDLKAAIWKFVEAANVALGESDAEIERTLVWVQTEQANYWKGQTRKRTELVAQAKAAVRAKKLFHADDFRPSAIEEEQALAQALRRLDEAGQRVENVKRFGQRLQKQMLIYRGQVQRMARMLQTDLPQAAANLEELIRSVEAYLALGPQEAGPLRPVGEGGAAASGYEPPPGDASMARPEPGEAEDQPTPQAPSAKRGDGPANEPPRVEPAGDV